MNRKHNPWVALVALILLATMLVVTAGCAAPAAAAAAAAAEETEPAETCPDFIWEKCTDNMTGTIYTYIITDTQTGTRYLYVRAGYGGGLTVLQDGEG